MKEKDNDNRPVYAPDALINTADKDKALAWASAIVTGDSIKFKKAEDVLLAMSFAQQVRIPIATALTNIDIIEGKVSIGTHLARALIQRGNIRIIVEEDYKPIYQYKDKDNTYSEEEIDEFREHFELFPSIAVMKIAKAAGKIPEGTNPVVRVGPINYRTTIRMIRTLYGVDGEKFTNEAVGTFSVLDAQQADLLDKSNWKKYTRSMLWARAFSNVASKVAADLLWGAAFVWDFDDYDGDPLADDNFSDIVETMDVDSVVVETKPKDNPIDKMKNTTVTKEQPK